MEADEAADLAVGDASLEHQPAHMPGRGAQPLGRLLHGVWADDDPVQRVTTYVPWELAEGTGLLAEEVGHPYGIHGIFEDHGHVMTRIREEVSARMPRPDERRDLRLPPGVPVLDVLHTSLDQHGQPYELTRFVMRADLTGLLYDVPVE